MKLSDKIWVCRKKAGLSQEALAERIGVSRQAISKWETGEASPEISKLPLLARTFGVTADWLLDDSAEPEEDAEAIPEAESAAPEADAAPEPRRQYSDAPVQNWPSWVENLPGRIGQMVKRFGWLFGVRIAIGGALFTAMGFVAKAMFGSMNRMANDGFSSIFGGGMGAYENAGVTFFDNAGNVVDPGTLGITDLTPFGVTSGSPFGFSNFSISAGVPEPFAIMCNFIIVLGLVMLIGGALLAWYLKKWGQRQA